jgi:hypothetical protein
VYSQSRQAGSRTRDNDGALGPHLLEEGRLLYARGHGCGRVVECCAGKPLGASSCHGRVALLPSPRTEWGGDLLT